MDRRPKRPKKRPNYKARRILVLAVFFLFVFGIYKGVTKLLPDSSVTAINEKNKETAAQKESEKIKNNPELYPNLIGDKNPLISLIDSKRIIPKGVTEEQMKELYLFRAKTLKDQVMGRTNNQKYLKKTVYLTFDDGPSSKVTPQVLDILKKYDIKATFFVIGAYAEQNPDMIKRIFNEGHQIANHSYSHNYKYIYANADNFKEEVERAENVIKSILGDEYKNNVFRFPGGSFDKFKAPFREQIEQMGYVYYDWNALNGDAEGNNKSVEYLLKRFDETSRGYNVIISLMHDTNAKQTTADSLPEIIERLIRDGYQFKRLDEV